MKRSHFLCAVFGTIILSASFQADGQIPVVFDSVRTQNRLLPDTTVIRAGDSYRTIVEARDTISVGNENLDEALTGPENKRAVEIQKMHEHWQSPENQAKLRAIRTQYQADSGHRVKDIAIRNAIQKDKENPRKLEIPDYLESEYFYYTGSKKIPLRLSEDEMAIYFKQGTSADQAESVLVSEGLKSVLNSIYGYRLVRRDSRHTASVLDRLSLVAQRPQIKRVLPVFYKPDHNRVIVADEVIVRFNENVMRPQLQSFNERFNLEVVREIPLGNTYVLRLKDGAGIQALRTAVQCHNSSETQWAHPNFYSQAELNSEVFPNDPLLNLPILYQWNLHDWGTYPFESSTNSDIDAPEAWGITKGNSQVKIAILDSGIELNHEDLSENTTGIEHYDVSASVHPKPQPTGSPDMNLMATVPANAHGTAVAGIAAAVQNNGVGISGVAPNCTIVSVRVGPAILAISGADTIVIGDFNAAVIATGILTAVDQAQAQVINMSFGVSGDQVLEDAIQYAVNNNCVLVAGTGNVNAQNILTPAKYPDVIAVGATRFSDERWNPSLYGGSVNDGSNYDAFVRSPGSFV